MSLYSQLVNRPTAVNRHRQNCSCADCRNGVKAVNIVAGFLGAGKTTMVNHLLRQTTDRKVDVVIREYGWETVDDKLLECDKSRIHLYLGVSLHESPENMLYNFLERLYDTADRHQFDNLLLEASGAESAEKLIYMFFTGSLRAHYKLGSYIALVDAQFGSMNLDDFKVARQQIAYADIVVINRCDLAGQEEIDALIARIRSMNSIAKIICTSYGYVDAEEVLDTELYQQLSALDCDVPENRNEQISTVLLSVDEPLDKKKLNEWVHKLFTEHGKNILRGKGYINMADSDYRYEFDSVRKGFHSRADKMWTLADERRTVIALIGEELPMNSELQLSLEACRA